MRAWISQCYEGESGFRLRRRGSACNHQFTLPVLASLPSCARGHFGIFVEDGGGLVQEYSGHSWLGSQSLICSSLSYVYHSAVYIWLASFQERSQAVPLRCTLRPSWSSCLASLRFTSPQALLLLAADGCGCGEGSGAPCQLALCLPRCWLFSSTQSRCQQSIHRLPDANTTRTHLISAAGASS